MIVNLAVNHLFCIAIKSNMRKWRKKKRKRLSLALIFIERFEKDMIKFEKVSYGQFFKDYKEMNPLLSNEFIGKMYDELQLPKRATTASAGYDFFAPFAFSLAEGETIRIPTGIRAIMPENVVLQIYPRSGLGFKYREQLDNGVGIIDSDFANSNNEGHIMLKITNDSKVPKIMDIERGKGFAQGIFMPYLVTDDDAATGVRNGGWGSTDVAFINGPAVDEAKKTNESLWVMTFAETPDETLVIH